MARRGRKRKIKLKVRRDTIQSTLSIVLLLAAGVIVISFFAPNYAINERVKETVVDLFGSSAVILPLILVVGGLLYTQAIKWKFIELRILFGLVGLLLGSSGLLSLVGFNGGVVGDRLSGVLEGSISSVGGFLVLAAALVISGIFIFDVSIAEIAEYSNKLKERFVKDKKKDKTKDEKEDKDDIKITSGGKEVKDEGWKEEKEEERVELPEPSFEIIPSTGEPKTKGVGKIPEGKAATIAPGLPYTDKIWEPPPLDLLLDPSTKPVDRGDVKSRAQIIIDTLGSFGVEAKVAEINYGPSVTQYALEAASGIRISSLHHDLALALASPTGSVRIEAPIPGKSLIGIEVPNNTRTPVHFKELLLSDAMKGAKSKRAIVLGKDVSGMPLVYDIAKMPHLLVAGSTGSGKSVFLHSLLFTLFYRCSPQECKFILIDPKRVELVHYSDIPYLLTPVVTDIDRAASVFRWAVDEMERRYKLLESAKARNIDMYNEKSGFQALPYIFIVVDELSEIMVADPARVEKSIIRLAQLARATGIHLILTVQRPSTNVITGLIKANIPCRVAFNVTSQVDSRVIIDQPGAEKLLGRGDMLFVPPDAAKPKRIQGTLVSDKEINNVVNYMRSAGIGPEYKDSILEMKDKTLSVSAGGDAKDDFFKEAVEIIVSAGKASASLLQRRLSIGYARAARILDELESEGYVGPAQGSKPRDVLIKQVPGESPTYDLGDAEEIPQAPTSLNI